MPLNGLFCRFFFIGIGNPARIDPSPHRQIHDLSDLIHEAGQTWHRDRVHLNEAAVIHGFDLQNVALRYYLASFLADIAAQGGGSS